MSNQYLSKMQKSASIFIPLNISAETTPLDITTLKKNQRSTIIHKYNQNLHKKKTPDMGDKFKPSLQ